MAVHGEAVIDLCGDHVSAVPVVEEDADTPSVEKPKLAIAQPQISSYTSQQESCWSKYAKQIIFGALLAIAIIVITCVAVLNEPDDPIPETPDTIDYTTGVSLILKYLVDTKVRSRLATTNVTFEVQNGMNCSSVHVVTLQLPLNTRVASLKTISDDGCTTNGDVKEIKEARDTFVEQTSQGLSTAYVEAQDDFTYTVQVSMPPYGTTKVELIVEQLLHQKSGEIAFELPLIPNEEVDSLVFDLSVDDTQGNPTEFHIDVDLPGLADRMLTSTANATNGTNTTDIKGIDKFHLDLPDARQHDLPLIVRGRYTPGQLPENGYLYFDGKCFEHYFLPPFLKPMPRNFIFVVDVSDSMPHDKTFDMTKNALKKFINTIDDQDSFSIQTFATEGTMDLWGPNKGTADEKEDAAKFLDELRVKDERNHWGTNLNEALLHALMRAKTDIKNNKNDTASILILVSYGWASEGETHRPKIVKNVYDLNKDGPVKIFALGFQDNADMQLLNAIALLNGGISSSITHGEYDFETQMNRFLDSEVGSILLADMTVKFVGDGVKVVGQTDSHFPLLASGYETVVRGLVDEGTFDKNPLKAVVSASTFEDVQNWVATATEPQATVRSSTSLCYQSYAHARVSQLVRLSEAADFLGEKLLKSLVTLVDSDCKEEKFVDCIKKEALNLAIDAQIVAKGLTAMVTVDVNKCMEIDDSAQVCIDGTTADTTAWGKEIEESGYYYDEYGDGWSPSAGSMRVATLVSVVSIFAALMYN